MQLKGNAKSIHVAQLVYENKWLMDAVTDLAQYCSDSFQIISDQIGGESQEAASDGLMTASVSLRGSLRQSIRHTRESSFANLRFSAILNEEDPTAPIVDAENSEPVAPTSSS